MNPGEMTEFVDESWPLPLTVPERIELTRAIQDLDSDYLIATVGTLQRSHPKDRPPLSTLLAAYRGVKSSTPVTSAPTPTGEKIDVGSYLDSLRTAHNLPTSRRKEPAS